MKSKVCVLLGGEQQDYISSGREKTTQAKASLTEELNVEELNVPRLIGMVRANTCCKKLF